MYTPGDNKPHSISSHIEIWACETPKARYAGCAHKICGSIPRDSTASGTAQLGVLHEGIRVSSPSLSADLLGHSLCREIRGLPPLNECEFNLVGS